MNGCASDSRFKAFLKAFVCESGFVLVLQRRGLLQRWGRWLDRTGMERSGRRGWRGSGLGCFHSLAVASRTREKSRSPAHIRRTDPTRRNSEPYRVLGRLLAGCLVV
jgi:hypothetical protein